MSQSGCRNTYWRWRLCCGVQTESEYPPSRLYRSQSHRPWGVHCHHIKFVIWPGPQGNEICQTSLTCMEINQNVPYPPQIIFLICFKRWYYLHWGHSIPSHLEPPRSCQGFSWKKTTTKNPMYLKFGHLSWISSFLWFFVLLILDIDISSNFLREK